MKEETFEKFEDFFCCTQCGECCVGFGGTEVSTSDIEKIASFIKTDKESFIKNYCALTAKKEYVLKQSEDGVCIFFKKNCSIHPVKPSMCKDWPFIKNIIKAPSTWNLMADACSGIKTNVPLSKLVLLIKKKFNKKNNFIL